MLGIKRTCEKALLTKSDFDMSSIALAESYKLPRLKKRALSYVWSHFSFRQILNDRVFGTLEFSSKSRLLEKRIQHVFSRIPNDVEKVLLRYPKKDPNDDDVRIIPVKAIKKILDEQCNLSKLHGTSKIVFGPTYLKPIASPW